MIKTDYTFTFEGFNFCANFEIDAGGLHLTDLWLESGIDDELIPVTQLWRQGLVERHLSELFKDDILNSDTEYYREDNTSSTFRPGY